MGLEHKTIISGTRRKRNVPVYIQDELTGTNATKQDLLDRLTVTTTSGKVFYADPISRTDLADAIAIAQSTGQTTTIWKLAEAVNGTKWSEVTLAELEEARHLGLQAKGTIIGA